MADLAFGAWAQTSIGAAITSRDTGAPDLGAATFTPSVTVVGPADQREQVPRAGQLRMLGPGGVARIDPGGVVRMTPAPASADAAANDLAAVELVPPELPWVLTPAGAHGTRRLRPWLVLVVVDGETPFDAAARPLPVLHAAIAQLPDLTQSWAWAHVQGPPGGGPAFARLICPRRLIDGRHYRACLVPATEAGRQAGLNPLGGDSQDHRPAWSVGAADEVLLPVYHWWEFSTARGGDFEQLVRRLAPAEPGSLADGISVDVHRPWPGAAPLAGTDGPASLLVGGAVGPLGSAAQPEPIAPAGPDGPLAAPVALESILDFRNRLAPQLNRPADRLSGLNPGDQEEDQDTTGAVAPPIYGGRHVLVDRVESNPELPLADLGWPFELNLDPARRIAAGLGAQYVRTHQEALMTRAWQQVGAIREANRLRALADLASDVAHSLHRRHVQRLQPGELLAFAAPAAPRTPTGGQVTLALEVAASPLPSDAATTPFARAMRRGGPIARRAATSMGSIVGRGLRGEITTPDPRPVLSPTLDAASMNVSALAPREAAGRLMLLDAARRVAAVNDLGAGADRLSTQLDSLGGMGGSMLAGGDLTTLVAGVTERLDTVRELVAEVARTDFTDQVSADGRALTTLGVQISVEALSQRLVTALHPGDRHARRLASRVGLPAGMDRRNLHPVMAYPTFPAPMALALLTDAPEWFLPGLGSFPAERVALVAADDGFVESFLVGLNHELMSELLWREYPTDRRGSPFRTFWPRPSTGDVPELHTWDRALGDNVELQAEDFALVLVRGEVVRRFPDMVVNAVRAVLPGPPPATPMPSTDPADGRSTMFVVPIDRCTALYALPVPPSELAAAPAQQAPGWFVVLQEHDYRMRFGFDLEADGPVRTWNDLDWATVDPAGRGFADVAHVIAVPENPVGLGWGPDSDATQIARISLQAPFRVAIHASRLLQAGG